VVQNGIDVQDDFLHNVEVMRRRSQFGELELMVMLAVIGLNDQAYAVPIARQIEIHLGRAVALASVYAALERLEAKGMVRSWMGEPSAERGGKARRYFQATEAGVRGVLTIRRVLTAMWKALPGLRERHT
jgi:PadR family transcriptional regulator